MISINTLFQKGSNQIEYKGKTINKFFKIDNPGEYVIKFFFISVNSHFNQAIVLFFNNFIGEYYLFNQKRHLPQNQFILDVQFILKKLVIIDIDLIVMTTKMMMILMI